ncbi:hypothetical protein GCM10027168_11390 [Streptomyces capparidis]
MAATAGLPRTAPRTCCPRRCCTGPRAAYPSPQGHPCLAALAGQARDLAAGSGHRVFDLLNRRWLRAAAEPGSGELTGIGRYTADRALTLAAWLDEYRPEIRTG